MTIQFPRVGDRFLDRYEIVEVLGAGGMSRVYGAVQDGLERKVAIKLLAPAGAENLTSSQFDNIVARFEREAKLISSFRSPHTVVMYDYGRDGDYLFMILEHVDGDNLHQLVENLGPLPASRVARIMRQALASLAEAHQMGILHRDIKPQNIMVYEHLGDPDNVKVLDFGIAKAIGETGKDQRKLTEERTIVGTPSYMSPEQILGHKLGPGSDIYSLGLVAYEMLFGIVAVEADSAVSTMARHLAPAPIEIPDDRNMPSTFLDILRKMIDKDVELRYRSAADVFADLNAWDGGDPHLTLPRISMSRLPQQDTLDGVPPVAIPQPTEQATSDGNQPLVVGSALLLTLAILLAVGVVVMLVWMMQPPADAEPDGTAAVAAMMDKPAEAPAIVAEPIDEEPPDELAAAEPATPDGAEEAEPVDEPEPAEEPTEPASEPDEKPEPKAAVARTSTEKKQAQKAEPAEEEPADAVEPPEPLVVVPPQPEPAPAAAQTEPVVTPKPEKKAEPKPEPTKTVAKKAEPKKTEKKSDDDDGKKKKKKKKNAPPLSF